MKKLHVPIDHFQLQFITNLLSLACLPILTVFSFFFYKRSLILSLLHHFFNLCSNYKNFHKELDTFKNIFKLNGYPTHFFDKCVCLYLDKVFVSRPLVHNVPKKFCISVFLSLALTLFKSAHKFLVFVHPPFPMSTSVSSFVQPSIFSTFSPLRTEFPKV